MKSSTLARTSAFFTASILACSLAAHGAELTWDTSTDSGIQGGDGDWNTTVENWTTDGGDTNIAWDNIANAEDIALFTTGTGRVTITENINLAGIKTTTPDFSTIGGRAEMTYVFQGDGDLIFGTQQGSIDTIDSGLRNLQIGNNLVGTGGLLVNAVDAPVSDQGWIYLTGDNSGLTGGITVQNGLIGAIDENSFGSNAISLQGNAGIFGPTNYAGSGGTQFNPPSTTLVLSNNISISGTDNVIRVWGGRTLRLDGDLTGSGDFTKADGGTLVLAGENSGFSGNIVAGATGVIRAAADNAFGSGTATLGVESGTTTRFELDGVEVGNDFVLDSGADTNFAGAITAIGADTSTINGDITVLRGVGNGGHLAATGDGALVLNGELNVSGTQTNIVHRAGTIEYAGGGSTNFTLGVNGTARIGAENGLSTGVILSLDISPSPDTTLDLNGFDQTVSGLIHTPTNATRSFVITGDGTLTVNANQDTELGPGGTLTGGRNFTADMSGLGEFEWSGEDHVFRVGLRSGTGNTFTGSTGTHTTLLADTNTITASLLAVGDQQANNHGGNAFLRLGQTNTINADTINIGASNRSNATLNFRDGLGAPTVTIRGTDGGSSRVESWDVGRVANFAASTWTATVNFTEGELDARVDTLRIGIANAIGANDRTGTQNSTFSMGEGTLDVTNLIVGEFSGESGSSAGTHAANGTFNLNHADGLVSAGDIILANNIGTTTGGIRNVTGTLNLENGTVEALTISRGTQTGEASNVIANFNFSGGTVRNISGQDLAISDVPVNLTGSGNRVFQASAGQTITVDEDAVISGTGGFTLDGGGTMVIESDSTYTGATVVASGILAVNGSLGATETTVQSNATLAGSGEIAGNVGILGGGTLSPGNSIGSLATGNLSMAVGSTFVFEAQDNSATGADLLVAATLALAGVNLDLSGADLAAGTWALGDRLTLISYTGDAISSGFVGYDDNAAYTFGTNEWLFLYADTEKGNNFADEADGTRFVTMTVIPEPGVSALFLLGALALLRRRRA